MLAWLFGEDITIEIDCRNDELLTPLTPTLTNVTPPQPICGFVLQSVDISRVKHKATATFKNPPTTGALVAGPVLKAARNRKLSILVDVLSYVLSS